MDLNYLYTFREVAKCQNFTRAAENLGYAQSSVTAQIQKLEAEFDVTLFERLGRNIRLTPSGEELMRYANQVIELLEEAKEILNDHTQISGNLSIGAVESLAAFYLPPYLQILRKEYPNVTIYLQAGVCSDLRQKVREGIYDLAIIMDRLQQHEQLQTIALEEVELALVSSPDHHLTKLHHIDPKDLGNETFIVTEKGCSYRGMLETVMRKHQAMPVSQLEFTSIEAIKQCVAYGLGIALLPRITVEDEVQKGLLSILPFKHPDVRVFIQLIYHKKKWISHPMKRLLDLLKEDSSKKK